ncbi:hypothetical protein SAMN02745898_107117 [Streptomyces sp. 136MFCol5.1]|uniref:hypothetical protein n=1 Tax=Streptomyces sp. 136MFCol5.1 TaxID=1172182 RepID=UPI0008811D99|nr:hypothetical protein [Streptomyces sp. 136MFCol5.1]SCZ03715.1 hypothetical protein SAMN02745898_107117 [Streptomyces sp. 136MFCol5.1]
MAERAWATAGKKASPDRKSPGRPRLTGVALIVLSLLWAVLSYLAFTVWVPGRQERYEHYRAAEPCPAQATPQEVAAKDCLTTWHFTVAKTESTFAGKARNYEATLKDKGDDSWQRVVRFSDSGPLFDELHRGDEVIATGWRRDIVVLSKDGIRQNTSDAPRDEHQGNAAMGVLVALLAAQSLVFGAVRLARPTAYARFVWEPYGRWLAFTNICVGVGVGAASGWLGIPWWTVLVTVPVVVCAVMARLLRQQRRAAASSARVRRPRWQQDSRVSSR